MTLTHLRLTQIDTPPRALAYYTPALVTTLSVIRICQALKLFAGLKTIALRPQLCSPLTQTCCAYPYFLFACLANSPSISKWRVSSPAALVQPAMLSRLADSRDNNP